MTDPDPFVRKRLLALFLLQGSLWGPYVLADRILSDRLPHLCPFHLIMGLPCPACGITRALASSLHGRWQEAVSYNPLVLLALPTILFLSLLTLWELIARRPLLRMPPLPSRAIWALFSFTVLFQVSRTALFFYRGGWPTFLRENILGRLFHWLSL